ncbi:tetratricopeptide repeat protein [bacterium]|nr:tetratricopeptide repeat protein [bacterium]
MKRVFIYAALITAVLVLPSMGQEGYAGVESPFTIGAGARSLGLGGTGSAFPDGPMAFFWNPAGMVVVQQRSLGLSLTTLFEGTQYNVAGYVHPTLSTGVLGIGIARIGTGDIRHIEQQNGVPVDIGTFDYWWGKITFGYAVEVLKGLAIGINVNLNRQVLGYFSANGFGGDAGINYVFPSTSGLFSNMYVGGVVFNAVSPRLKLGVSDERVPLIMRGGIAKVVFLRGRHDRWLFLADVVKHELKPFTYHFGTEYSWNGNIFLRAGWDNGKVCFGGGIRLANIQFDYGTEQIGDPVYFPASHRFSLVFFFGQTMNEKRRIAEERHQREIQQRIAERIASDRKERIKESLFAGKRYLDKKDYFNARLEFSRVLREDPDNSEAKDLLAITTREEEALQQERQQKLLKNDRERMRREIDNKFVDSRFKEGLSALEQGDFRLAIEKWQNALKKDPQNTQIASYIGKAKAELAREVNKLLTRTKELIKQDNISEAYRVLERAKDQAQGDPELQGKVLRQIKTLDRALDFVYNYQEGLKYYGRGDYKAASRFFKKAVNLAPKHQRARELYRNSVARAQGSKTSMTLQVKKMFSQGISLYRDGHFKEALSIWNQALEKDPTNIKIIEAIEGVKRKIAAYGEGR